MKTKLLRKIRRFYEIKYWVNPDDLEDGLWMTRNNDGEIGTYWDINNLLDVVIADTIGVFRGHNVITNNIKKREKNMLEKKWKSIKYIAPIV